MLQSKSRWKIRQADHQKVNELVRQLNITPLVATLLANRGIDTVSDAKLFLDADWDFHDPYLLNDMDICVKRIKKAIDNREKIVVYGDYDADGVTSTVVLLSALEELGADCGYYIPDRFKEGYGLNETAVRLLKAEGYQLIITVDNGIASMKEAKLARELGMDLIITDHHEPGPELPDALAIIHPKREDSNYPFKDLAGVGVAFKVASALLNSPPHDLLGFVAIGTVADLVSLTGENRLLVKKGLTILQGTNHPGLVALMKSAGISQQEADEDSIGFALAPRINAAGRLEHASLAVELFLADNFEIAEEMAVEINDLNSRRQEIVNAVEREAIEEIENNQLENDGFLIVGKEDWHPGVIGIVCSRLVEKYYRPAIVFSFDMNEGLAKGSARSIPNFNLYKNLSQCKDLLPHFGGHPMAAGMTVDIKNVEILRKRLNQLADEVLTEEDLHPVTEIDGIFSIEELSLQAVEEMNKLTPFGTDNPKPQIMVKDIHFSQLKKVGADEKHLKLALFDGNQHLDGIAFYMGGLADQISPLAKSSVIGEVGINEWNNNRKPQIIVKDVEVSEWQLFDYRGNKKMDQWVDLVPEENRKFILFNPENFQKLRLDPYENEVYLIQSIENARNFPLDKTNIVFVDMPVSMEQISSLIKGKRVSRVYAHFYKESTNYFRIIPNRNHFKWYYVFLTKKGTFDLRSHGKALAKNRGWSLDTIEFMTKVFAELDFVNVHNGVISVKKSPQKRNLKEAPTYKMVEETVQLEKDLLYSPYKILKEWFDVHFQTNDQKEEEELWI